MFFAFLWLGGVLAACRCLRDDVRPCRTAHVSFFLASGSRDEQGTAPFHMDRLSRHRVGCMAAAGFWSLCLCTEQFLRSRFLTGEGRRTPRKSRQQQGPCLLSRDRSHFFVNGWGPHRETLNFASSTADVNYGAHRFSVPSYVRGRTAGVPIECPFCFCSRAIPRAPRRRYGTALGDGRSGHWSLSWEEQSLSDLHGSVE